MNAQLAIAKLRADGWTDAAIARRIGCSQPTITRIRHGKTDPRESTARALEELSADTQTQTQTQTPPTREQRHGA